MIGSIPPELFLVILSHLPLNDISAAHSVCSEWHSIIQQNAETVYLHAATFHSYRTYPLPSSPLSSLSTCKQNRRIERAWTGYAPSKLNHFGTPTSFVHRFKVDEKNGLLICSHKRHGIKVWCTRSSSSHRLLWQLEDVRAYAHVEYSNGFLIFDREEEKAVWIHEPDFVERGLVLPAEVNLDYGYTGGRGTFRPWAVLVSPEHTRAYRFIYPTLLVASEDSIYLWDIPTARITNTIHNIQGGVGGQDHLLGRLTYVELSLTHVFVAGVHALIVYKRPELGQEHVEAKDCKVLYIPTNAPSHTSDSIKSLQLSKETMGGEFIIQPMKLEDVERTERLRGSFEEFVAVHVDPTGTSVAALLRHGRLLIISNFGQGEQEKNMDIQLGPVQSVSKYMAYEHGRIAVATTRGVFIIHLPRYSPLDHDVELMGLRVSYIPGLGDRNRLMLVTCLQLSPEALWLNWKPGEVGGTRWPFDDDEEEDVGEEEGEGDNGVEGLDLDGDEDEDDAFAPMHHVEPSAVCRILFDIEDEEVGP